MRTLVIHPTDQTTEFLSPIYAHLMNKTVVKGGITKSEVQGLIESHDRDDYARTRSPLWINESKTVP